MNLTISGPLIFPEAQKLVFNYRHLFLEVFYLPGALTWLTVCGVHNGY